MLLKVFSSCGKPCLGDKVQITDNGDVSCPRVADETSQSVLYKCG